MNLKKLNPEIHSAAIYERSRKSTPRGEHVAYGARLIYIFSGDASCIVDKKNYAHLGSGSLLYIPAGAVYSLKAQLLRAAVISFSPSGENLETTKSVSPDDFKAELCPPLDELAPFDGVVRIDELESIWDDVQRICDLFLAGDEYSVAKAEALLRLLLIKIAETVDENALPLRMTEALDEYIREHAGEEISNTEVGAIFGYHPFYVSTVIKEKRGMTLRQYVISYRLKLAVSLLEHTDKTIAEIAEETGFTDASYFTKSFKAAFGETPKEWRAKCAEDFI